MEQYMALTRGNQERGMVKHVIANNVNFEIKSQFMRELREDTFSGNNNDDAHALVEIRTSSSSADGIAAITSKLDSLERGMKKLKENVHAIQENTKRNLKHHDDTIRTLDDKIGTLTKEVQTRVTGAEVSHCKVIFTNKGLPLYTPFDYSPEELDYLSSKSYDLDEETWEEEEEKDKQKVEVVKETHEVKEANETKMVTTSHDIPIITHYVTPYESPILFPGRLAHHAKEALMSRTMESLRKIRVKLPLIKEIRKTDDYARHMKNLVVNKPRTLEEGDVKLNATCSVVLQNQMPPKEKDPGSFILPCSIGLGKLKIVNMTVEVANRTKSITKGIVENLLESHEEIDYRWSMIDQGEPWVIKAVEEPNRNRRCDIDILSVVKPKVHWCKEILQQKGDGQEFWAACDPYDDQYNGGDVLDNEEKKRYWICMNDDKRLGVAWEGMSFKDWEP
ncbi:hypothetical protein Tco_1400186 [Tanacetum coccineum]